MDKFLFYVCVILFYAKCLHGQSYGIVVEYLHTVDYSNYLDESVPGRNELQPFLNRYEYAKGKSSYRFIGGIGEKKLKAKAASYIYKDLERNTLYYVLIKDTSIVAKDTLECETWELQGGEEKEIAGYLCKKAIFKAAIAWYCEELPVSDGPLNYCGLPGLILRVEAPGVVTEAIRVEISHEASPVEIPKAEKYLTPAEYRQHIGF
jgi:GLPGLI family protein